jgi:hypothetical protein
MGASMSHLDDEEKKEMNQAFNEMAMRAMFKCKRIANMTALVNMLTKSVEGGNSRLSLDIDDEEASLSPGEISSKGCLIICKLMDKSIRREKSKPEGKVAPFSNLDLSPLFSACAEFLEVVQHDVSEEGEKGAPLRTVKLVLQNIAQCLGRKVFDFTSAISPNSAVVILLEQFVPATAATTLSTPAMELSNIFAKLQVGTIDDDGISELFEFQSRNPNESMEPLLSNVSSAFRDHIKQRLQEVGERKSGRSSVPSTEAPFSSAGSLSMASIRARLAANSSSSSSSPAPRQVDTSLESSSNNMTPKATVPTAPSTTTTAAAAPAAPVVSKKPLDLASLRARLQGMKNSK